MLMLGLLFSLIAFFGAFHIKRTGAVFSLPVFFNAYSLMYFVVGVYIYAQLYHKGNVEGVLNDVLLMCFMAVFGFNAAYIAGTNKKLYSFERKVKGYTPAYQTLVIMVAIALLAKAAVIVAVGPYEFFFITRTDRFPIKKAFQPLLFISNLTNVVLPLFIARYFLCRKKKDLFMVKVLLSYHLFMAVILISRSALAFNFICLFYFLELHKYISKKSIIVLGVFMAVAMFFYKGFLYGVILGAEYESFNPGEFINWIRNTRIMLDAGFTAEMLPNNSYILALQSMFVPSPEDAALSEWFIREFYPERVVAGLTYGFSGVLEGYLYLGLWGVFLHFAVFGFSFSLMERLRGSVRVAITICALFIMFRVFRSEMYNFAKTFTWYYLYQILGVVVVDYIFKRVASKRSVV